MKRKKFDYFIDFNYIKLMNNEIICNFKHCRFLIFVILTHFDNCFLILRMRYFHI